MLGRRQISLFVRSSTIFIIRLFFDVFREHGFLRCERLAKVVSGQDLSRLGFVADNVRVRYRVMFGLQFTNSQFSLCKSHETMSSAVLPK